MPQPRGPLPVPATCLTSESRTPALMEGRQDVLAQGSRCHLCPQASGQRTKHGVPPEPQGRVVQRCVSGKEKNVV